MGAENLFNGKEEVKEKTIFNLLIDQIHYLLTFDSNLICKIVYPNSAFY